MNWCDFDKNNDLKLQTMQGAGPFINGQKKTGRENSRLIMHCIWIRRIAIPCAKMYTAWLPLKAIRSHRDSSLTPVCPEAVT